GTRPGRWARGIRGWCDEELNHEGTKTRRRIEARDERAFVLAHRRCISVGQSPCPSCLRGSFQIRIACNTCRSRVVTDRRTLFAVGRRTPGVQTFPRCVMRRSLLISTLIVLAATTAAWAQPPGGGRGGRGGAPQIV